MRFAQKLFLFLLAGVILLSITACSTKQTKEDSDQSTIKITITQTKYEDLEKVLVAKFPDIHFEFEQYKGPATTEYLRTQLLHDDAGDIFFSTLKFDNAICKEHLMDMAGYNFVGNYESSLLTQYDVDGGIYLLPGPVIIRSMVYNKTLFEEKGWKVPTTHGELVNLVKQIRDESDLTPISFGAKGQGYYFTTMTTYAQTAYYATAQGREWEEAYLAGDVSCKDGFQSGIDMLQQMIDADAYDIELDKENWDAGAVKRLVNRESAMVALWGSQENLVEQMKMCTDELALFPFYNENGDPFLGTHVSTNIGLTKHLEKPENEEKLKNAIRVMEWLSTPEGMSTLNTGMTDIIPLTLADNRETSRIYRDVWETHLSGLKAPMLYAGYEDVLIQSSEFIRDAMVNRKSLDGLVELIDDLHQSALKEPKMESLGSVPERFSHEETVQLMANILYDAGFADVAFVSSGGSNTDVVNYRGVSGRVYEGDLYIKDMPIWLPGNAPNAEIEVLKLTGKQIRSLVENGRTICMENGSSAAFDYYWAGMEVDIKDGVVREMKLNNGMKIVADGIYSVAFARNDYNEDFVESEKHVIQNVGCQDVFTAYLKIHKQLTPPEISR